MKTWAFSVIPAAGTSSLDGFALGKLTSMSRRRTPVKPCFIPAPVDRLPQPGQLPPAERHELTRPYSSPSGPAERASAPQQSDPSEPAAPAESPVRPVRPEESRPYALPSAAGQPVPAGASAVWVPSAEQSVQAGPLARFRRRMDGVLSEMLGDDHDLALPHPSAEPDKAFWGADERKGSAPTSGYRSKHRLNDQAREPKLPDGQRRMPRHAAPPASFSARLTGRYAAHAAW